MKLFLLILAFLPLTGGTAFGQILVSGSISADGTYTSITNADGAFNAVNAADQTGTNILISVTSDATIESGTIALNAGNYISLTISPSGGMARSISGTVAGASLILLNGADHVTIDGLNAGGNSLTISNLSTSATSMTSTIGLKADATYNIFTNCSILGAATVPLGTNGGTIFISTGSSTGNDNNTISNCLIGPAGTNLPSKGIFGNGSTSNANIANSNINISNCEIYDFFLTGGCAGIYALSGNTEWTISGNKFYQTASRTFTATGTLYGIYFSNSTYGDNVQITNNTIGYANGSGTGTLTLAGTVAGAFRGIYLGLKSTPGNACNINNNIISDISLASTSGLFYGIYNGDLSAYSDTININGNQIKNISLLNSTGIMAAIYAGTATTLNCSSNTIENITRNGNGSFRGIQYSYPANINLNGNTIRSFHSTSATSTAALSMIYSFAAPTNENITGNNIYDISSNAAGTQTIHGIYNNTSGTRIIQNNYINNIAGGGGAIIYGIRYDGGTICEISGNQFHSFSGGATIYGIYCSASNSTNHFFKNKIYDFSASGTSGEVNGIYISSGATHHIYNNFMGDLKAEAATGLNAIVGLNASAISSYQVSYNSISLNATSTSATTFGTSCIYFSSSATSLHLKNNILVNLSTPAQEGANNYVNGISACLRRSSGTNGSVPANYATSSNYNDFYCNPTAGTNNHLTYVEGTSAITNPFNTVTQFQAFLINRDQASFEENPPFLSMSGDSNDFLHIDPGTPTKIESGGNNSSGISDDYDGDIRHGNPGYPAQMNSGGVAPDTGADEFDGTLIPVPKVLSSITYNQASTITVLPGASDQEILRLDFFVTGNTGTLVLNSIVVNSLNTDDADVNVVKLYATTLDIFSTANAIGSSANFSESNATFSSLSYELPIGTTYIWVAYDVSSSATPDNFLDAQIESQQIDVGGTTFPDATISPTGNRQIVNQIYIGNGSAMQQYPLNRYYNYSTWEGIYLASEIGSAKDITNIAFFKSSGTNVNPITSVTIYMKNTYSSLLYPGEYSLIGYSQVFSGSFTNNATNGWMEITLDTPFSYNGTENLQILIIKGYQTFISNCPLYYSHSTPYTRCRQYANDQQQPGIPGGAFDLIATASRPNLKFKFNPAPVMTYSSSTATQDNTSFVVIGNTDQTIIGIEVETTYYDDPISITSFTVNANGSSSISDILNAKIYYTGTYPSFDTINQFGSTFSAPTLSDFDIIGSQTLATGINYFWLTFDIAPDAVHGNEVDAECTKISVANSDHIPAISAPEGSRQILGPMSGIYNIGLGPFNNATGKNVYYQRYTRKVERKIYEEEYYILMENGLPYTGNLSTISPGENLREILTESFISITEAINNLNLRGVSGPVTFFLNDSTFPGETYPIVINSFNGSSQINTVTIKPASGVSVTITGNTATSTIKMSGCDYVIIDGSNQVDGSTKDLLFGNVYTGENINYPVGITHNGSKGATNCTVKNCIVTGSPTVFMSFGILIGYYGGGNHNTTIKNNTIKNAKIGIYFIGSPESVNNNGLFTGNTIGDMTHPIKVGGVMCAFEDNAIISENEIFGEAAGNNNHQQFGILIGLGSTNTKIQKNNIHDFYYNGTGGYGCSGIDYNSDASTITEISNNFITNIKADGNQHGYENVLYVPSGITIVSGGNIKMYHNSVYLADSTLGKGSIYQGISSCISIDTAITGLDLRNNVLRNSMESYPGSTSTNNTYCVLSYSANTAFTHIDYNDYYNNGINPFIGYIDEADQSDLTAWQNATGQDFSSISGDPGFTSTLDLHILADFPSPIENAGYDLSGQIPDDIDGDLRNDTPDIGADEFSNSASPCQAPYDPFTNEITDTSATFNWSFNVMPASDFDIYFGPGSDPFEGNLIERVISPFSPNENLMPQTEYSWAVRANCGFTTDARVDRFWIAMNSAPDTIAGLNGGSPIDDTGEDGKWQQYFDPLHERWWYNIWFYNSQLDTSKLTKIRVGFWIQKITQDPAEVYLVLNYSDSTWTGVGFPSPTDEIFIKRSPLNGPIPVTEAYHWIEMDHQILDFNPAWVSVDVWGANFVIPEQDVIFESLPTGSILEGYWSPGMAGGVIVHECMPKPDGNVSSWVGPQTFTTPCSNVTLFPWAESFEDTWHPECWNDPVITEYGWDKSVRGSAHTGSEWAYCNLANSDLTTPSIDLLTDCILKFWYRAENSIFPQNIEVGIGGTTIWSVTGAINETYQEVEVPLASYKGSTIQISFISLTGTGGLDHGICLDDVLIEKIPFIWEGDESDDWFSAGNWDRNALPGIDDLVIIPSTGVINFPLVSGQNAYCCDIVIGDGGTLTVLPGCTLIVNSGNY